MDTKLAQFLQVIKAEEHFPPTERVAIAKGEFADKNTFASGVAIEKIAQIYLSSLKAVLGRFGHVVIQSPGRFGFTSPDTIEIAINQALDTLLIEARGLINRDFQGLGYDFVTRAMGAIDSERGPLIDYWHNKVSIRDLDVDKARREVPASGGGAMQRKQVVLLLHGIRTNAFWHQQFDEIITRLEKEPSPTSLSLTIISRKYGYFPVFEYAVPFFRRRKVEWLRDVIEKLQTQNADNDICVVAHSFGTYLLSEVLKRNPGLTIHSAIFCGSVVKRDFEWDEIFGRDQIQTVINDCGTQDVWPVLSKAFIPGTGDSGVFGFDQSGASQGGGRLKNRFFKYYGHGSFFNQTHIRSYWWPFLSQDQIPAGPHPVPKAGVVLSALSHRWVIRLAVLILLIFFWYLPGRPSLEWHEHRIILENGADFPPKPLPAWADINCVEQNCWLSGWTEQGGASQVPTDCGHGVLLQSRDLGVRWHEVDKQTFNSGTGHMGVFGNWSWTEIGPIHAMRFHRWQLPGTPPAIWGWLAACSGIYGTEDGGEHWRRITPSPDQPGGFAHYSDIDTREAIAEIYAVGWQGIIHASYPYDQWSMQKDTGCYIDGIWKETGCYSIGSIFVSGKETWAVGHAPDGGESDGKYYGGVYHLTANRADWKRIYRTGQPDEQLNDIFVDNTTAIVVGTKGLILRGTRDDGGNWSWSRVQSGVKSTLYSVAYTDKDGYWVVGEKGVILFSNDQGESWRKVAVKNSAGKPIESSFHRIRFANGGMGWIVGEGVVLCARNQFNPYCGTT